MILLALERDRMVEKIVFAPLIPELCCSDIKTSLLFYTKLLGFNIEYQRPGEGFAMLERQGARIMLDAIDVGRTWLSGRLEAPFGRGVNLEIKTDKVMELYGHVQKAGANIFLPLEEKWYCADNIELCNRQFIVLDPDGYMLRFSQNISERKI